MNEKSTKTFPCFGIYMRTALLLGLIGGYLPSMYALMDDMMPVGGTDIVTRFRTVQDVFIHFGLIGLSLMGTSYLFLLRYRGGVEGARSLPIVSLWIMVLGIVIEGLLRPFYYEYSLGFALIVAGILQFLSIIIYSYSIFLLVRSGEKRREKYEEFLIAGCIWFLLVGWLHVCGVFYMVQHGMTEFPDLYGKVVEHIMYFGFFFTTLIGISIKGIPDIMGYKPAKDLLHDEIFLLLTLGIILMVYAYVHQGPIPLILSSTMEFFGLIVFILSLPVFRTLNKNALLGINLRFTKYIRTSYFWLTVYLFYVTIMRYYTFITMREPSEMNELIARTISIEGGLLLFFMGLCYRVLQYADTRFLFGFKGMTRIFWVMNAGIAMKLLFTGFFRLQETVSAYVLQLSQALITVGLLLFILDIWKSLTRVPCEEP